MLYYFKSIVYIILPTRKYLHINQISLTLNLRDLPWINSTESNEFFPRSYLLSEDEKDPITGK